MQHVTAALAAPRVLRHARRALLLVGAAFAWWLLFSGGSAQAADASSVDSLPAPVVHAQPDPLGRTTQTVTRTTATATTAATTTLRTAPHRLTDTVTRATSTAPEPVRSTIRTVTTALEPSLTKTTTAVADTLDHTVRTVQTAVQPTLDVATPQAAPTATAMAETPAQLGIRALRPVHPAASADRHQAPSYAVADTASTDHSAGPSGVPGSDRPGVPAGPSAPVLPGTGSAPAGPLAALGGLLLLPTRALRRRRLLGRAVLRPDPVYPPGCSPD